MPYNLRAKVQTLTVVIPRKAGRGTSLDQHVWTRLRRVQTNEVKTMPYNPHVHHRKSIRLKGHDYREPGSYYVSICSRHRRCIFGTVEDAGILLSALGKIVKEDWKGLPSHYPHVGLDTFQIMPNHLHGIVEIREQQELANQGGTRHAVSLRGFTGETFGKPRQGTLSTIIGAYKSGVTFKAREGGLIGPDSPWQSRFHDHIIRSDVDMYMIRQYIELNPLMWQYDLTNPHAKAVTWETFERLLVEQYDITGNALYMILASKKMNRIKIV